MPNVRQTKTKYAKKKQILSRHVIVLCKLSTPRVIRAIKECLPSSFNVQVLPWAPEIELATRLAGTPADELVALGAANTTRFHVAVSPHTIRVIEAALQRLNRLVRLQLTKVRLHALAETLRVDKASLTLPLLETFGAEIDHAGYCYGTPCTCLIVTAQLYDHWFERDNGTSRAFRSSTFVYKEEKIVKLVIAKCLRSLNLHISALHDVEDKCCDAGLQARVQALFDASDLERFSVNFE